ncbi:MAG TPA: HAD-IA family hydrolase [Anaerolineales bacterium]
MIRAVIFDFDGLIIETERPSYQSWVEVYQSFGQPLPFKTWSTIIGTTRGDFNPRLELEKLVNEEIDWETVELRRIVHENTLIEAQPVLPGVVDYLRQARDLGLKIGMASNSSCRWVIGHLRRIGLVNYFDCIRAADDTGHLKPDPELYLSVLGGLQVSAGDTIAFEDSPIGIRAAKAAGVYCVAVPNEMTRGLELTQADYQLTSLADMPLEKLLQKIKTQRAA